MNQYYENLLAETTGNSYVDAAGLSTGTFYYAVIPVDDYNNKSTSNTATAVVSIPEIIIESRAATAPAFTSAAGTLSNTGAKSTAPGVTPGIGSLYGTTINQTATYAPGITEPGLYDVFITLQGGAGNSNANAQTQWTIATPAGGNESGTITLAYNNVTFANTWGKLNASPIPFGAGAAGAAGTLVLQNLDGNNAVGKRFNVDSARFLYVGPLPSTGPSATSITTAWPNPSQGGNVVYTVQF
ncbi:MAG: hypothetical protein HC888_16780 [Candidatus Competibacteraceae bacterium]|nr:hypothetical protein [Candidatus Competibacteraceae bacterium]